MNSRCGDTEGSEQWSSCVNVVMLAFHLRLELPSPESLCREAGKLAQCVLLKCTLSKQRPKGRGMYDGGINALNTGSGTGIGTTLGSKSGQRCTGRVALV